MDPQRFDAIARALAASGSRRRLLAGLAAAALGLAGRDPAAAFVCRTPGQLCREHADCCSRVCGPKDATGRRLCVCASPKDCPSAPACTAATCGNGTCGTVVLGDGASCTRVGGGAGYCCNARCVGPTTVTACGPNCTDCTAGAPANTVATCDGGGCSYPCDTAHGASGCGATCCGSGQTCCGDVCKQAANSSCTANADCCSQVCVNGTCQAGCGEQAVACDDDGDCCSGLTCQNGNCACPTGKTLCNSQCVNNCRNGFELNPSTCTCECPTGKKVCAGSPSFCVDQDLCCSDTDCVQACRTGSCCTPQDAALGVCKGFGLCQDFSNTCFAANPCETASCATGACVRTTTSCSGCFACDTNPGSATAGQCAFDTCRANNPCQYCDGATCRADRSLDYQSSPCRFHGGGFCYDGQCVACLPSGNACTDDSECCTDACQPNPNGQIGSYICTCVPAGAPGCTADIHCCNNCCASGGFCAFFSEDLNNCGACGVQVPAGGICDNGTPTCTLGFHNDNGRCCPVGASNCGSYCANTSTDPLNCGSCGRHCDVGHPVCASGRCCTIIGTDCY